MCIRDRHGTVHLMPVPKTSVNKNHDAVFAQYDIQMCIRDRSMGTQSTAGISMPVSGDFHHCKRLL